MATKELELLERFAEALPKLSEYEKGYINGVADNAVNQYKADQKNTKEGVKR